MGFILPVYRLAPFNLLYYDGEGGTRWWPRAAAAAELETELLIELDALLRGTKTERKEMPRAIIQLPPGG